MRRFNIVEKKNSFDYELNLQPYTHINRTRRLTEKKDITICHDK